MNIQIDFAASKPKRPQATVLPETVNRVYTEVQDMTYNDHEQFGDSEFKLKDKITVDQDCFELDLTEGGE